MRRRWRYHSRFFRNPDERLRALERQVLASPGDTGILEKYLRKLARTTDHKVSCSTVKYHLDFRQENETYEAEIAEFLAKWPDYCTDCGGWGGKTTPYDPSPGGIGLSPGFMYDYDPCTTCVEEDICPLCGEESINFIEADEGDYSHCFSCGWDERNATEGMSADPPWPPECDCWDWGDAEVY